MSLFYYDIYAAIVDIKNELCWESIFYPLVIQPGSIPSLPICCKIFISCLMVDGDLIMAAFLELEIENADGRILEEIIQYKITGTGFLENPVPVILILLV